jgi:hypothetical protein
MFRKPNSAAISHPSLLTACQMALAVTSGLSRTCAVSGLVTHINAHNHRNLRKEAPMLRVGATGTNKQQHIIPPVLHTHVHTYCSYQKDKRAKPGSLPRSNALSEIGEH